MDIALLDAWRVPEARDFFTNVWPMFVHEISGFDSHFYSMDATGRWLPDIAGDWIASVTPDANLRTPRANSDPGQPFQRAHVITHDGKPIGFICVGLPPFVYMPEETDCLIAEFFLIRPYRGSEAAHRALELLLDVYLDRRRWHLRAVHDNARAIAFWTKTLPLVGVREIEQRKGGGDVTWHFVNAAPPRTRSAIPEGVSAGAVPSVEAPPVQAAEFIQLVIRGDERAALAALQRDPSLASVKTPQGVSIVCLAVYRQQHELAASLAASRSDLDVFEAACLGDVGRVQSLIAGAPACVNAVSPDGFSPVGYSAYFGHVELLRELLRHGGDVNAPSQNAMRVCPLHSAAATSDRTVAVELARIVLQAGANPNATQQAGFTALHEAALNGNTALVSLLLQHGADPRIANDTGTTAIDLAREKAHTETLAALEQPT